MAEHKTFIGKLLALDFAGAWGDIKAFVKQIWQDADHDVIDASINITQFVKEALENDSLEALVAITSSKKDDEILAFMQENLAKVLSSEFLLDEITPDSTKEEISAVLDKVFDQYRWFDDEEKQQVYTSFAANLYRLYLDIKQGKKVTFGTAALLVESAFKVFKK